jgi:two-component system chemotaxis sensor kinase CheA
MSIDLNDEIVQDFLVEAGELLEQLGEQLVELEREPQDKDLLNAVFRAFHTIKGGAGFISLTAMVELCHRSEDVFNRLRNGEREVDADLMDAVLRSVDVLQQMFDDVHAGNEPDHADPQLIAQLEAFADPDAAPVVQEPAPEPPVEAQAPEPAAEATADGDITDDEFEALLDALQAEKSGAKPTTERPPPAQPSDEGEISDDEFENLLDQLHGKGQHGGAPKAPAAKADAPKAAARDEPQGEAISEDEFEDLLDQLHGKGHAPGAQGETEACADEPAAKPPPAAKPKPAPKPRPDAAKGPAKPELKVVAKKDDAHAAHPAHQPTVEATVRVDTRRLDDLMNLVGELVLVRNRLATLQSTMGENDISKSVANLDQVTSDIQAAVMKTRMQPIKKVFGRFPRVVRDLARSLKKEVELELVGEETDLDKNLVEALADPLVHLVRNAVDHGVESPEERSAKGKARAGRVVLSAKQAGDHILITIQDDGKGMDPDVLRAKAVEKGLMTTEQSTRLSDREAFNLIFAPGFSTKTEISDVSGRGVGMDVVKTRIAQLNGSVEIDSERDKGTMLSIKLPLTLAILPTLMIVIGEQRFALPLSSVCETYELDLSKTNVVDDQEVLLVRDKPLPLFYLRRWLDRNGRPVTQDEMNQVVVVQVGSQRVCFVVDELLGQEEVVIKPLGVFLQGLPGFAGATITGDGRIALIVDVPGLLRSRARAA